MTSSHTPGPWESHYLLVTQQSGRKQEICHTGGNRPSEQAEADARLIAAAPDMLTVLDILAGIIGSDHPHDWNDRTIDAIENMILSVIAQATGKSNEDTTTDDDPLNCQIGDLEKLVLYRYAQRDRTR